MKETPMMAASVSKSMGWTFSSTISGSMSGGAAAATLSALNMEKRKMRVRKEGTWPRRSIRNWLAAGQMI
jgi:phage-related minor tail protein